MPLVAPFVSLRELVVSVLEQVRPSLVVRAPFNCVLLRDRAPTAMSHQVHGGYWCCAAVLCHHRVGDGRVFDL